MVSIQGASYHVLRTSEVEATNVVNISVLNQAPDLRLLQVVKAIVVRSTEVSDQRAVLAGDDGAAAARLLSRIDAVLDTQASSLDGVVEDGRVLVVTGTSDVDDAVRGEDVLGATGRVLSSAAGDELGVVVVEQFLVERDVLLLGQDGIVGLEIILVEEFLATNSLDI